jgi:hypothetical protein
MSEAKIVVSAQDNASKVLQQVRSSMGDVQASGAQLAGTLAGLGIAFSAVTATAWVKNIVDGVDALNDIKDASGSSIENISALESVADRTGTSFETMGASLLKFNESLNRAEPDSATERAIKAIGLSTKELKALDPAEALRQTAVALSQFADDGNKARLTQELFGKSLKDIAPFLTNLAEQGQLNATVTAEQATAAELFNKQLFAMAANSKEAGRAFAADLLPTITQITKEFTSLNESGGAFTAVGEGIKVAMETVAIVAANVSFVLSGVGREIGAIAAQTAALATLDLQGFNAISQAVKEDGVRARAELDALERRILQAGSIAKSITSANQTAAESARLGLRGAPSVGDIGGKPTKAKKPKSEEINDNARALASYVQSLQSELSTTEKLSAEQKALNFLKSIGSTGEVAQVRELVLMQAKKVDSIKAEEEAQKALDLARKQTTDYFDGLAKELDAQQKNTDSLRQQVEEVGLTTEQLNTLKLARLDAAIAQEQQTAAALAANDGTLEEIKLAERRIELLKEQRQLTATGQIRQAQADTRAEADKASKDFANTLHNDLKGAFSAAFRDTQDPLKAFGDALENVVFTRAATALADALAEAAIQQAAQSSAGSIGSGIGSFISSLFPSFDGGGTTGAAGRTGGLDGKGGFMALLHPQETVLDHTKGQTGSGGGAVNITQNIQIDSRSDQSSIMAAMYQAKEMAKAEILRSRQRGGAFA